MASFLPASFLHRPDVLVLDNREVPDLKAVGVIVRAAGVHQSALRDQCSLRDVTLTDDGLPCKRPHLIRIAVEVAYHAVHPHRLVDIARDDTVIFCVNVDFATELRPKHDRIIAEI